MIRMTRFIVCAACALCMVWGVRAQSSDNGDGTFTNPVLWADVPDPDVIRVGNDYYMVSTTMHLMPGAPVMHSKDLVNWRTVGYIYHRLDDKPSYDLVAGGRYTARGVLSRGQHYGPVRETRGAGVALRPLRRRRAGYDCR